MQKYDRALMEGVVSPKRMSKKRMKAFIESVSSIIPPAIVEAVVNAHKALFEYREGRTLNGVRYKTGLGASDPRKTNNWGYQTIYNGNDAVRRNSPIKPPTSGGTDWHLQTNTGTAAYKHYDNIHTYKTRERIDPREYQTDFEFKPDDSWENTHYQSAPTRKDPPQSVHKPTPPIKTKDEPIKKEEPQKKECPPVCPEHEVDSNNKTSKKQPTAPKTNGTPYKWNNSDFKAIEGEDCSETHKFVINLVSFNKDNRGGAMSTARTLSQIKNIPGVYTYQYDGLAQNTTREDVWRVRIGFFKSKAAARYFFRKYVFPHVGNQYNWWVGRCDDEKGDKMKPNTFALGRDIKENECVDISYKQTSSYTPEKNVANSSTNKPTENKQEHMNILDYARSK